MIRQVCLRTAAGWADDRRVASSQVQVSVQNADVDDVVPSQTASCRRARLGRIGRTCWPRRCGRARTRRASPSGVWSRYPDEDSLPEDRALLADWQVVMGTRGLAAQRNAALERSEMPMSWRSSTTMRCCAPTTSPMPLAFLERHPEVVALTGRVLLDGATKGEIPTARGRRRAGRLGGGATDGALAPHPGAVRMQLRGAGPGSA